MDRNPKLLAATAVIVVLAAIVGAYFYRQSVQSPRRSTTTAAPSAPAGQLVREDSPSMGPENAKVTLVEFFDPECESCAAFGPVVKKIVAENEGNMRLVLRYMPLHPNSTKAATFLEVAGEQGKYWQALQLLFAKQGEWGTRHGPPTAAPAPDINVLFKGYAGELGLDAAKLEAAIKENRYSQKLERDKKDGQSMGVRRTPTFFVNGRELARFSENDLRALIAEEMRK